MLLQLGSAHTSLFHRLRQSGQQVTREFSSIPYKYDFSTEGLRRPMFQKEVDDQLTARILLEQAFAATFDLYKISQESDKLNSFRRKVVSGFSLDEIRNIFERLAVFTHNGFKELFSAQLKEKGINIPQTERELDEFLARRE